MPNNGKPITVAISGHWLLGCVPLFGSRLQETLNDSSTDFLTLINVEVHPLSNRGCITLLPEVTISKAKVRIIAVPTSQHEAPEKRWNNRTSKEAFRTFAIASNYRVSGDLHLPSKPNGPPFILVEQLKKFFALTDASFSLGKKQLHVPLLLVNKDVVSCFHVGEPVQVESAGVADSFEASAQLDALLP